MRVPPSEGEPKPLRVPSSQSEPYQAINAVCASKKSEPLTLRSGTVSSKRGGGAVMSLKEWCMKNNVSISQLQQALGRSRYTVSKLVNGEIKVGRGVAALVVRLTNGEVSWESLLSDRNLVCRECGIRLEDPSVPVCKMCSDDKERHRGMKQRTCLSCGELFYSWGPANRICKPCRQMQREICDWLPSITARVT